jgi:hypothetical protein
MTISGSNPSATADTPVQDTQMLVALLGSLMPLLLQIQSQGPQSPGAQPPLSQTAGLGASSPLGFANRPNFNPMVDHQAAVELVEDMTADSLRRLSTYMETYAPRHAGLEGCVGIVTQAAHCFAMRDYAQAFDLTLQAYRTIAMLRASDPQLPALRAVDADPTAAAPNTMMH